MINGKEIKGYSNYIACYNGRIWSNKNKKYLKEMIDHKGYHFVSLYHDGMDKRVHPKKVHRLIAETLIKNPLCLPQVNHISGNKNDNSVNNLEWITGLDNIRHAIKHNLMERTPSKALAKTTMKPVLLDIEGNIMARYDSSIEASKNLNMAKTLVSRAALQECRMPDNNILVYDLNEYLFDDDTYSTLNGYNFRGKLIWKYPLKDNNFFMTKYNTIIRNIHSENYTYFQPIFWSIGDIEKSELSKMVEAYTRKYPLIVSIDVNGKKKIYKTPHEAYTDVGANPNTWRSWLNGRKNDSSGKKWYRDYKWLS